MFPLAILAWAAFIRMGQDKKKIRQAFRDAVFSRDNNCCKVCGSNKGKLDAHHITPRTNIANGGYVLENGVSLCANCHEKAEEYYKTGTIILGYSPEELYNLIDSSVEKAIEAAGKLK